MAAAIPKSQLRETWESAAPGWAKWETAFSSGLTEATDALLDMAAVKEGMRVLDVACGAGNQTIQAARRVGPNGKIVASDISATMLDHVRRSAARESLNNIEILECAADDLDHRLGPFDAAICRLGLMLFPSPRGALEAIHRVLRDGARFAALVFTTPANNPFFSESLSILRRHAGKPAPQPGSPGLFALGGDGVLEAVMRESGLVDVKVRIIRATLRLPSVSDTLQMMQEAFGAYRAVVADLDDARRRAAWAEVGECLKQFEVNGGFKTDFEVVVGSGAKAA
ncbi:MAG TPA: methyltransferase domain-containing protein [Hyphomicrobiaceae bacterium]|nr:methyltransferase domain-containing protein [Hyphomicrobiaceae bacterium]